jgi:peroxiredoxin Q/BCP
LRYWEAEKLPFIGLPDPKHIVANLYGQEVNLFKLGRVPALMLIDTKGQVRYQHYSDSMSDIPENQLILGMLDKINRELG